MRVSIAIALVTAVAFACAPAAFADVNDSANWAGYAVHRSGVSFRNVSGTWTQPGATCTPGKATYSAFWVGLGGFSTTSTALEQIGTEVDCNPSGREVFSAWYELVPAPSTAINLPIRAGDVVHARVEVNGRRVVVALYDFTRHSSFKRTLYTSSIDVSSAEWIVEAPSDCVSLDACETLPLANFGSAIFASARARSTSGQSGPVTDPGWGYTRILLAPGGKHEAPYRGSGPWAGAASPSVLEPDGASFTVSYAQVSMLNSRWRAAYRRLLLGRRLSAHTAS